MAKIRSEITEMVELNTGRTNKTTLINRLYDNALKEAVVSHVFQDSLYLCDDITITEEATSVSLTSLTSNSIYVGKVQDVITARIVEADGTYNNKLTIKNRQWWIINVVNAEDNMLGWPIYGIKEGSFIKLDRPAKGGLELRLQVSTIPEFGLSVEYVAGEKAFVVGEQIYGATTSTANAYVESFTLDGGSYDGGDARGTLYIINQHGTFTRETVKDPDGIDIAQIQTNPSSDNSECPIDILDIYLEQYATAFVFLSLEKQDKYAIWHTLAIRTLDKAISKDRSQQAEDKSGETGEILSNTGIAITDIDTGITKTWY